MRPFVPFILYLTDDDEDVQLLRSPLEHSVVKLPKDVYNDESHRVCGQSRQVTVEHALPLLGTSVHAERDRFRPQRRTAFGRGPG